MNHALKLVVGLATVTGLMGSEIGVANATAVTNTIGAASTAFVGLSATNDVPYIDHNLGRFVTNIDTAGFHNAVASLGIITGSSPFSPIFEIRGSNSSTDPMVCDIILNDVQSGAEQLVGQQWLTGQSGIRQFSGFSTFMNHSYTATAFCSIPKNVSGGAQIFAVWTQ